MNSLPFEVREKILNKLPRKDLRSVALINSQWRFMCYRILYKYPRILSSEQLCQFTRLSPYAQSFVQVLDLTFVYRYVNDKLFQFHLQHLTSLKKLVLNQCVQLSSSTIHSLIQNNLFSLRSLSLADCKLSKNTLALIGEACQHRLTSLDLSNTMIQPCSSIDSSHDLQDLLSLSYTPQLLHLDLSYCAWVSNLTVKNIARGLPKLQHIILQWCSQIKADAILEMVQHLMHLNTMDIRNIDSIRTAEQVENLMSEGNALKKVLFTYKRSPMIRYPS